MEYRRLGRSGLRVAAIGLGSMQFGWSADEAASHKVLDAYADAGGNFIDTADVYSTWTPDNPGGVSEEIIGRWLRSRRNRDAMIIATKVRGAMGEHGSEGRAHPLGREGLSRRWIMRACEDSLRRLGVDHIDLYQVHWVDRETPIEETLGALSDLVHKGYVRYLGCSNFPAWRLVESLWVAERHHLERFVSLQPEYSLVQPTRANFERELAPACVEFGIGVVPYSPLAGGFLTGKYQRGAQLPESVRAKGIETQRMTDQNWHILETVQGIAREHSASPAQVALSWLLAQPWVTAPIVGANDTGQLADLLGAPQLKLSADELSRLAQVSDWQRSRADEQR